MITILGVLYMLWRYACGLDIIVTLFWFHFFNFVSFWHHNLFSICIVSLWAKLLTLLCLCFEAFSCVFFIVWRSACGFDIISTFFQLVCHFSASQFYICYIVGALSTTYSLIFIFFNCTCVFFIVWRCACGFYIIVSLIF